MSKKQNWYKITPHCAVHIFPTTWHGEATRIDSCGEVMKIKWLETLSILQLLSLETQLKERKILRQTRIEQQRQLTLSRMINTAWENGSAVHRGHQNLVPFLYKYIFYSFQSVGYLLLYPRAFLLACSIVKVEWDSVWHCRTGWLLSRYERLKQSEGLFQEVGRYSWTQW